MNADEQRTTPKLENPAAVEATLQQWLADNVYPEQRVTISNFSIPEATGMSNITVLFDVMVDGQSDAQAMVARIQAQGDKLAFPHYDLPLQVAIMQTLETVEGIRVPSVIAQEKSSAILGSPFYIMQRVDGLIPPDIPPYHMDGWIVDSSPEERGQLWWSAVEMMATLHQQDIQRAPLAQFIQEHDFSKNLDEQLDYWQHYQEWGLEGADNAHCSKALAWLREHKPEGEALGFCWGDSRMANVIFNDDKSDVAALLDWEMLALGNPLQDIAWWIFMDEVFSTGIGFERLEGFPTRAETMQKWCALTGLGDEHLHYYLVFAGLRISLILARMSLAKGDNDMLNESFASVYMDSILEQGAA